MADVSHAIIGVNFLSHYGLLPNLKNKWLIDDMTKLEVECFSMQVNHSTVTIVGDSKFATLLAKVPGVTQPRIPGTCSQVSETKHLIETTGPPIVSRARRSTPGKLKLAKAYFEQRLKNGVVWHKNCCGLPPSTWPQRRTREMVSVRGLPPF